MWLVVENGGQGSTGKYISGNLFSGIWKFYFFGFGLVWIKVGEIYKKKKQKKKKCSMKSLLIKNDIWSMLFLRFVLKEVLKQ